MDQKGHTLLGYGDDYFDDKIQIDWGSFAWRCTPEQVVRFLEEQKNTLPWLIESEEVQIKTVKGYIANRPEGQFGILFIEID